MYMHDLYHTYSWQHLWPKSIIIIFIIITKTKIIFILFATTGQVDHALAVGGLFSGKSPSHAKRRWCCFTSHSRLCSSVSRNSLILSPACQSRPLASSTQKFTCVGLHENCLDWL